MSDIVIPPNNLLTLSDYLAQKTAGTLKVIKVGGVPHASVKRFDPITGSPIVALVSMNVAQLQTQKAQMVADCAAIDQLLSDIEIAAEVVG